MRKGGVHKRNTHLYRPLGYAVYHLTCTVEPIQEHTGMMEMFACGGVMESKQKCHRKERFCVCTIHAKIGSLILQEKEKSQILSRVSI